MTNHFNCLIFLLYSSSVIGALTVINSDKVNVTTVKYSDEDRFSTASEETVSPTESPTLEPDVLNFLLIGDWGKGGLDGDITATTSGKFVPFMDNNDDNQPATLATTYTYQAAVARAMAEYSDAVDPQPSFVIALGDNFYTNGVQTVSDSLWSTMWTEVYLSSYPQLNIPWYAVFGNHDYGYGSTGVQAQIARSESKVDNGLWVMPATNYSQTFSASEDGVKVIVVFIDTTTLAPSENKCCNSKGGVSESLQLERINNQLTHIDLMLAEAAAGSPDWLLVAGHYPVYSHGAHGDTSELLTYLLPLLQKYEVDAYLCGHDHISEHLSAEGIEYFVAGAGSMTDSLGSGSEPSGAELKWSGTGYSAFAAASATTDQLTISYHDIYGDRVYEYTMWNAIAASKNDSDSSSDSGRSSTSLDNANSHSSSSTSARDDYAPISILYEALIAVGVMAGGVVIAVLMQFFFDRDRRGRGDKSKGRDPPPLSEDSSSVSVAAGREAVAAMMTDYSTHTNYGNANIPSHV